MNAMRLMEKIRSDFKEKTGKEIRLSLDMKSGHAKSEAWVCVVIDHDATAGKFMKDMPNEKDWLELIEEAQGKVRAEYERLRKMFESEGVK